MSHAQYLLRDSAKSGKEIAALIDFADHSYFGRAFHRATGQTPMAFRRNTSAAFSYAPRFAEKPGDGQKR